jgi:hypothetical protein
VLYVVRAWWRWESRRPLGWLGGVLDHAYRLAKANGDAAGVDGVTFQ